MSPHPLQRLQSPSRSFSLLLHVFGALSFSYNFYFLTIWDTPFNDAYGWHFQFLTIIGLLGSLLAFVLGILADLTLSRSLFAAKNMVSVLATPLEVVVAVLYWGLSFIDPKLVFDGEITMPFHIDLGFHMFPAVFLTLDLVLLSPPWTIPVYGVMTLSTALAFMYWYWIELCFTENGWYPYPLFELLNTPQRILLFSFSALLSTASSVMLRKVYGLLNGYEASREQRLERHEKVQ